MKLTVRGVDAFCSTGGKDFDPNKGPVLVFIHGSGQSHLTWLLQGRFFANRGFQVLSLDLPGHGFSEGPALTTIEDQADWCAELLAEAGVSQATLIGHSQGCLVALELVHRRPAIAMKLVLIAGALAIPVNDYLVENSRDNPPRAIAAMMNWGFGKPGDFHDHTMPGVSHFHFGSSLMSVNQDGALHSDLLACGAYTGGATAAAAISIPTLCILARSDKMTPIKAGKAMAQAIKGAELEVIEEAGHMVPGEKPFELNQALRRFLQ